MFLPETSGKTLFHCVFQLEEAVRIPWPVASGQPCHASPRFLLLPLADTGPTQITQERFSVSRVSTSSYGQSPSCHRTSSLYRLWGLVCGQVCLSRLVWTSWLLGRRQDGSRQTPGAVATAFCLGGPALRLASRAGQRVGFQPPRRPGSGSEAGCRSSSSGPQVALAVLGVDC